MTNPDGIPLQVIGTCGAVDLPRARRHRILEAIATGRILIEEKV
jgi:hypothetical protein